MDNLLEWKVCPICGSSLHVPVDDQEITNVDHFHFFINESCIRLMKSFTEDIRYGN